jgi:DNA (cytosine-5)-methyltransferase 1
MARVVGEVQPQYVFVENTPTLVDGGLAVVLGDLASMGYDARWCVLGADAAGYPHHRARLWLVAYSMRESVQGDVPQPVLEVCGVSRDELGRRIADVRNGPPTREHFYRGKSDGVADYMDQWKAIGNGQVPAVAALAWRILSDGII